MSSGRWSLRSVRAELVLALGAAAVGCAGAVPDGGAVDRQTSALGFAAKVNFQLAGGATPSGYLADTGDVYGPRSGGGTYGWNINHTDVTRKRNINSDLRLDTLCQIHVGGVWEMAVPNGTYDVLVTIGDPGFPSTHTLRVEGTGYWSGLALNANQFATLTRTVTVSDGKLTLDVGGAAEKATRVDYLEVNAAGGGTGGKINFQLAGGATPSGYLADTGDVYGPRSGGGSYGWNVNHTDVTRTRNINADVRLDTLCQFHTGGVWEMEITNGTYDVLVTIGDAGFPSTHTLRVEGVSYWSGQALNANQFATVTKTVTVGDGRLTLDSGGAADKATRIDYLEVTPSSGGGSGGGPVSAVTTNRYDDERTGANAQETTLTPANVRSGKFGLLFSRAVDGQLYAQPLYLKGVTTPDNQVHNVVYVATAHNTVYAFDADNAGTSAPLWQRNLGPSGSTSSYGCSDMTPEVGIIATPVIDAGTGVMYVVAKGQEGGTWVQRLHALDVATGAERPGSPVTITATVPGTGDGSSGGQVTFDPYTSLNRPGLLFRGGTVYLAFASHCDKAPYHGWIMAYSYNGAQLQRARALNLTPNGRQGGIWQAGVGLSANSDSIYFAAGNGSTNPLSSPPVIAEGVGRISLSDFSQRDYWIPTAYASLNGGDADLASGAVLMPHNMLMTGGKDGRLYVLDSTNLGGYHTDGDHIIQTLSTPGKQAGQSGHLHGAPVYYNIPGGGGEWFYMWPEDAPVVGYKLDPATRMLGNLVKTGSIQPGHPGGMVVLSSNGSAAGTGIVWASGPKGDAWHQSVPGILYAYDASSLTTLLWSSDQNAGRDAVGNFGKFNSPMVVNGRVYLATFSNTLRVYGLLP